MLSESHINEYRENGFLVVPQVFNEGELAELNAVTDEFIEYSKTLTETNDILDLDPRHTADEPRIRRIQYPHRQHPAYDKAMRKPELVHIVQQLFNGVGVRFDHSKLNFKPVGGGATVEWHQDWAFFPYTNDDMLTVGLYLKDCSEDMGPLQVVPGSHRGPVYDHNHEGVFVGAVDPADFEGTPAPVALPGSAGDITIHHVRALHGSTQNQGSTERRLLLNTYVAVDSYPLYDDYEWDEWNSRILTGEIVYTPRMENIPVRIPQPGEPYEKTLFENQEAISGRSFGE